MNLAQNPFLTSVQSAPRAPRAPWMRLSVATRAVRLVVACAFAWLLAGCQSARVGDPLTRTVGGNDPDQQMEFLHRLADRRVSSNDDAFHAVLLFLDGQDPAPDYPARLAALRKRGMLPGGFDQGPDRAIERGTLAVALVRALAIKGGVTMSVLGASPRYAVRELQFLDIYPVSSPNQTLKGSELLSILSRAEDYQRTRGIYKEPGVPTGVPQRLPGPAAEQPTTRADAPDDNQADAR